MPISKEKKEEMQLTFSQNMAKLRKLYHQAMIRYEEDWIDFMNRGACIVFRNIGNILESMEDSFEYYYKNDVTTKPKKRPKRNDSIK